MVSEIPRGGEATRELSDEPPKEPLVIRVAASVLLLAVLPPFALAFLASLTFALVLLLLFLGRELVRGRRGAVPHEARVSPSHRGEARDMPRA